MASYRDRTINIAAPPDFGFWSTVWSSGWCGLSPFAFDEEQGTLFRIEETTDSRVVRLRIKESKKKNSIRVDIESLSPLSGDELDRLEDRVRNVFRINDDYEPFYHMIEQYPKFRWVREIGAGRMIRSPTVFEDIIKTICTTNCLWRQTVNMVAKLCNSLGNFFSESESTFPKPGAIASASPRFMKEVARTGYRGDYLIEFAKRVASDQLDVEQWRTTSLNSQQLKKEIKGIKGCGEYAASNILKLLGRYDYLALDSWMRKKISDKHFKGRQASDKEMEKRYKEFWKWKGLVAWLDLVKEYLAK